MLLNIVVLLLAIGLTLIGLGYATRTSIYGILGFIFLIFVFIPLMNGDILYSTGINTTATYSYVNDSISSVSSMEVSNYAALGDTEYKRLGLYGIVVSVVGMIAIMWRYAKEEGLKKSSPGDAH